MNCPSCGHENIEGNDRCENCLAPFRDLDVPRADSAEGLARSVMEDNLSELDHDETICVKPDTPALEVARLMKNSNCGCALVVGPATFLLQIISRSVSDAPAALLLAWLSRYIAAICVEVLDRHQSNE